MLSWSYYLFSLLIVSLSYLLWRYISRNNTSKELVSPTLSSLGRPARSRPSRMSARGALAEQQELHSLAYAAISRALDLDSTDKYGAHSAYVEGAGYIRRALALQFTPSEWSQAQTLAQKMQRNLASVEARELELRASLGIGTSSASNTRGGGSSSPGQPQGSVQTSSALSKTPPSQDAERRKGKGAKVTAGGEAVMERPPKTKSTPGFGARLKAMMLGKPKEPEASEPQTASSQDAQTSPIQQPPPQQQKAPAAGAPSRAQTQRLQSVKNTRADQCAPGANSAHSRAHLGPTHHVTGRNTKGSAQRKPYLTAGSGRGGGATTGKPRVPNASRPASASGRGRNGAAAAKGQSPTSAAAQARAEKQKENLKKLDPKMRDMILNEIVDNGPTVGWDDIAGLEYAKQTLVEAVILPTLRPELFTDLRSPPKGLLLFGPPGTGKTLLGKAVANESKSVFFSISAASLTSKFVGESEKMVRTLFELARYLAPSIIFIDEIDALLSARSSNEHEASRRLKTEFLVQLDGMGSGTERVLCMGATNRPQELDEAARRRLVKRIYIPLPDTAGRISLISNLMKKSEHNLSDRDLQKIAKATKGYSGSDLTELCREAAYGPIREHGFSLIDVRAEDVREVSLRDFDAALSVIRPSVDSKELGFYEQWNKEFGSSATTR